MATESLDYPVHHGRAAQRPLLTTLGILIVAAPFFNAGLEPLHRLLLQSLGLLLVGLALWQPRERPDLTTAEAVLLGILFLVPPLYLIPWPATFLALLPGRDVYDQALAVLSPAIATAPRPWSLHPFATELAWLVTLIPLGVYLASRALDERRLIRLIYLLFGVALFQVLIGLFQFATASSGVEYALAEWAPRGGSASGTYRNRNHLAGLLEMVFPLTLALFLFHFGHGPSRRQRTRGWREKTIAFLRAGGRPSLAFGLLTVMFLVGIVVTRSRTGIGMAMLGLFLVAVLFSRHIGGGGASIGLMGRIVTLAIGISIALGLAPVLDRFALSDMEHDARWPLASATLDGAGALLPLGSGPGTYPDAFPLNQPVEVGEFFINHAHNDYLEALYEIGVWTLVLLALFLSLFIRQWPRLLAGAEWSRFRCLQIGAGVGITLILGHSLTDYNLHTPANLAYFALLAGIFFSPPGRLPLTHRKQRSGRRTRRMDLPPASEDANAVFAMSGTSGSGQTANPESTRAYDENSDPKNIAHEGIKPTTINQKLSSDSAATDPPDHASRRRNPFDD